MRVLQVLPTLDAGGAESFVTELGVELGGLGVEVQYFLLAGVRGARGQALLGRLREADIPVTGIEDRSPRSVGNLIKLTALISRWRPHIVQANLYSAEVACAAARLLSRGRSGYVHRLASTNLCYYRSPWVVRMVDKAFEKTVACSPVVAEAYLAFVGGIANEKAVTIRNGVAVPLLQPGAAEKQQARASFGLSEHAFVVGHIGRMIAGDQGGGLESDPKAHDILLKAFAKAFKGDPGCVLLLVGDGPLRPVAESLALELGIAGQVRFLGQQPAPWPVLQASDVFCFPSRHEGMPNALIEAATCALPAVTSNIAEITGLYDGDAWLRTPVDNVEEFADGLCTVRSQHELYAARARDAAAGFRARFSMRACAEAYKAAFETLLDARDIKHAGEERN